MILCSNSDDVLAGNLDEEWQSQRGGEEVAPHLRHGSAHGIAGGGEQEIVLRRAGRETTHL